MARDGQTFELPRSATPHADLFTTQAQRDDAKREKVIDIPLTEIDDFPDHPFQVRQDEAMLSMVESVKAVGVQTPAIARQKEDGRYELISGHRRKLAATLAGLDTMPIIVRDLSRDEAIIAMRPSKLPESLCARYFSGNVSPFASLLMTSVSSAMLYPRLATRFKSF
jgi:ParB family chromosome partitioning protein